MNGVSATVVTENTSKGEKSADTVRPHVNVVLHLVVNAIFASLPVCTGHRHYHSTCQPYMQKTCDVAEMAILAKKFAEKVRKSRQNVNRDKSA